jgi:hypothetical protein
VIPPAPAQGLAAAPAWTSTIDLDWVASRTRLTQPTTSGFAPFRREQIASDVALGLRAITAFLRTAERLRRRSPFTRPPRKIPS